LFLKAFPIAPGFIPYGLSKVQLSYAYKLTR
jgi:hypothetical protein